MPTLPDVLFSNLPALSKVPLRLHQARCALEVVTVFTMVFGPRQENGVCVGHVIDRRHDVLRRMAAAVYRPALPGSPLDHLQ